MKNAPLEELVIKMRFRKPFRSRARTLHALDQMGLREDAGGALAIFKPIQCLPVWLKG